MAVNECFLDSATLRENVVSLARNIGYVPRSARSAMATINFSVDLGTNDTRIVTLKAGQVALGNQVGGSYIFPFQTTLLLQLVTIMLLFSII